MSTLPDPRTSADGQISGRIQHGPRPHSPAFMTGPRCWCVSFFLALCSCCLWDRPSSFGICLSSAHGDCPAVFCSPAYLLLLYPLGTWEWRGWRNMVFFLMESCICVRVRVYAAHLRLYFLYPVFVFRFRFPSLGGCYSILLLVFDCCNPCCPCARACPGEPPITPPFRSPRDTLTAQPPLYCIISQ